MIEPTIVSFVGPSASPPEWAIEEALAAASHSPCQKRKVGISVYRCLRGLPGGQELVIDTNSSGYNGPPFTWNKDEPDVEGACDGSEACRRDCARRCVHAEVRAIDTIVEELRDRSHLLRLVHVKLDDAGKLKACNGPSCIDCSKFILDCGIGGIWLLENPPRDPAEEWSAWYQGREPERDPAPARWRYYPAKEFHQATMVRLGIHQVAP